MFIRESALEGISVYTRGPQSHLLSTWTSEKPGPSFSGSGTSWRVRMWHLGDLEDTGGLTIPSREPYRQQDTSLLPSKAGKVLRNHCPWDASAHSQHGKSSAELTVSNGKERGPQASVFVLLSHMFPRRRTSKNGKVFSTLRQIMSIARIQQFSTCGPRPPQGLCIRYLH